MRGLANDSLTEELLSRYGLGGADGFSPIFTLSMTETKTTSKYQTLGSEGVNRGGNIKLKAGDGIDLENGVRVHGDGDMDIDAPEILAHAAKLNSSFDQSSKSESLNITPTGQIQGASYSQSKIHSESTNYVNAELSSGGNMRLHHGDEAMDTVVLDGANLSAKTLDADINKLYILDKQDVTKSETSSASASTNGQVSFYKSQSSSKITNQHSGIYVEEGINNYGHSVHVNDAYMKGGEILTDGKNNIEIDHLTAVELHDETQSSGVGVSVNVNDLGRLSGHEATNETGEQALAFAEINYDKIDCQATQTSVLYGKEGTNINVEQLDGNIHTQSSDGRTVTKDNEVHLIVDVPITNASYLESASKNFKEGTDKAKQTIDSLSEPKAKDVEPMSESDKPSLEPEETIDDTNELDRPETSSVEPEDESVIESILPSIEEDFSSNNTSEEVEQIVLSGDADIKENIIKERWEQLEESAEVQTAKKAFEDAEKILQNNPTEKNQKAFNDAVKHCVAVIIKEAANNGWDLVKDLTTYEFEKHIQNIIGPAANGVAIQNNAYMSGKGALIGFAFNLAIASIDKKDDMIQEAISQSTFDISFGLILKYTAEELSGPIGWALVGIDTFDTLFYDQALMERMLSQSIELLKHSERKIKNGQYLDAYSAQAVAVSQTKMAAASQSVHMIPQASEAVTRWLKSGLNKLSSHKQEAPVNQTQSVLKDSQSPQRHRFFSNDEKEKDTNHRQENTNQNGMKS